MVAIPSMPPVYIEQEQQNVEQPATESQTNFWYYCHNPKGYYPYVKKCSDDWLPVAPHPTESTAPTTQ